MRILLIEDHPKLAEGVARGLRQAGYSVDVCQTGLEGEDLGAGGDYGAIVLDVVLPDRDGIEVCRNLRRRGVKIPILMLTALSGTGDRVDCLNAGADDFLTKPFEFEDLLAALGSLVRHSGGAEDRTLRCEDLVLDPYTRRVTRGETTIELTEREYSLLEYLMRHEDCVVPAGRLATDLWDMKPEAGGSAVSAFITSLRRKIDRGADRALIQEVEGGYRFGAPD